MDDSWSLAVNSKFGTSPEHLTITRSMWILSLWRSDDVPYFATSKDIIADIDKIHVEMLTNANTTVRPLSMQANFNILTNAGMAVMAGRSVGSNTTTNTHHGIGTGTTAENLNNTQLETQVARKTIGTSNVLDQTERYGSTFDDSDVSGTQQISEAGIFTAATGGTLIARVTASPQQLGPGTTLTVQTNITHANGTS